MIDDVVHVSAPARLHLGFLDPGANFGRRFGGIGLAIDGPATGLVLSRKKGQTRVFGSQAARAEDFLDRLKHHLGIAAGHELEVTHIIPGHSGLGSGTQLALAVSCALRTLEGLPLDVDGDASVLGRGQRSGLGSAFVMRGGLAVDGGKGAEDVPPPLVARFDFPDEWRVILAFKTDLAGIHGEDELAAFAALPDFPESAAGEVSALTLMQVLPGLVERDIDAFGNGITRIQQIVGSHFAPAQGGVFTSPEVAGVMQRLASEGAHGIGQSSWGPTGFAFCATEAEARRMTAMIEGEAAAVGVSLRIAKGRNGGATIKKRRAKEDDRHRLENIASH